MATKWEVQRVREELAGPSKDDKEEGKRGISDSPSGPPDSKKVKRPGARLGAVAAKSPTQSPIGRGRRCMTTPNS